MKIPNLFLRVALAGCLLATVRASSAVFTNHTANSPLDGSHDGTDLVSSNSTVAVDGAAPDYGSGGRRIAIYSPTDPFTGTIE